MYDLTNSYNELKGKYQEAELLYKECFEKRKSILGENHPDTLNTMNNLAITYNKKVNIKKLRY